MRIFHIATAADWAEAQRSGRYTTSTRGVTLAEEGFIHASRADQWQGVRDRFYADVTEPLVLLVIDTERLTAPVVVEPVGDSDETFPHVYGVIEPAAVVQVIPLEGTAPAEPPRAPAPPSATPPARPFFSLFLEEMAWRAGLGVLVMAVAVLVGLGVGAFLGDVAALVTMLALLVLGIAGTVVVLRRRERRLAQGADSTE